MEKVTAEIHTTKTYCDRNKKVVLEVSKSLKKKPIDIKHFDTSDFEGLLMVWGDTLQIPRPNHCRFFHEGGCFINFGYCCYFVLVCV